MELQFNAPLFDGLGGIETADDVQSDIGLVGFWTFHADAPFDDLGLDDGTAQTGHIHGDTTFFAGALQTDGQRDYFDVTGDDAAFDLAQGTVALQFTQETHVGKRPNTIFNRGEAADADSEGWFAIQVTRNGAVQIVHDSGDRAAFLSTDPGFFEPGDELQVEYNWNADTGAQLSVKNVETGGEATLSTDVTGLSMDIGDSDDESFTFAAREADDGRYDQFFEGEIDFVALFNTDAPALPDGSVDGEAFGEDMALGYDDGNAPTDQGGDQITTGDDLIFGNGGDDTIDGDAGNDTIFGDDGGATGTVSVTIDSSNAGFNNALFAYVIDVETGVIDRIIPLSDGVKAEIGSTFTFDVDPGETIGLGIVSPQGTFLSSGYDDNIGLNPDSLLHTALVEVDPQGPVTVGFEDLLNGGDADFNDVVVTIDLGNSGATFDNAHVDYNTLGTGVPGDDVISGGFGNDEIYGEEGDDTLDGGAGVDTLSGGAGADRFENLNAGDVVDGGSAGDDNDTLDLTGSVADNGSLSVTFTNPDSNGNGFDGFVTYFDDEGRETGTLNFTEVENVVPCFTPGTMIATPRGEVPIETLKVGDRVITRDNGIQKIQWVGRRKLERTDFQTAPYLKPICIRKGALGYDLPERDMMVSPQHRVLVSNDKTTLYFEEREVLVAAKHLVGLTGIEVSEVGEADYIHLMFEQHEVLLSDGIWSESFQPGDMTLGAMGSEQRKEIFQLFPDLKDAKGQSTYAAARRSLKKHEATILLQ